MLTSDYEILKAVNDGEPRSFSENYPPQDKGVSRDNFERLRREGYINTEFDTSESDKWGYMGVSLTTRGLEALTRKEQSEAN